MWKYFENIENPRTIYLIEDKSNEIMAIRKLLVVLDLNGCIITFDAMGCQKEIAKVIKCVEIKQ